MVHQPSVMIVAALVGVAALAGGCQREAGRAAGTAPQTQPSLGKDQDHQAHPVTGPHGGELIELGSDEFHAELVHDEQGGTVAIHLLDARAEKAVPIDAAEVTINLRYAGHAAQHALAAAPDADDPPGKASRFVSREAQLDAGLEQAGAELQVVVMIDGRQYRGRIAHVHHDHEPGSERPAR